MALAPGQLGAASSEAVTAAAVDGRVRMQGFLAGAPAADMQELRRGDFDTRPMQKSSANDVVPASNGGGGTTLHALGQTGESAYQPDPPPPPQWDMARKPDPPITPKWEMDRKYTM